MAKNKKHKAKKGRLDVLRMISVPLREVSGVCLRRGGGTAKLTASWRIRDLSGKPEGLAFTATGRAIVALDTRKARHNLVVLDPEIAAR